MGRIVSYPARQLRRRRREWLRGNAVLLVSLGLAMLTLVALASVLIWTSALAAKLYVLGVLHAGVIAVCAHVLNAAFLAHNHDAIWQLRGAWGEDNTRSELQRAKRRRLIWDWVDSVELQAGDIDHIVVTRSGGVVAIDSKWRNRITKKDVTAMADSSRRAALRAEGLLHTVLKKEKGARRRASTKPVTVTPVVVLWGASRTDVPSDATVDDVRFLDGHRLLRWFGELDGHDVPREAARDVVEQLEKYRAAAIAARK